MGQGELFVVLTGRVAITRRSGTGRGRSELIGPGETFGELSVLDPGPRERTATAMTPVRLAVLDREPYLKWALARPHVAERLLRVLARRLRRTDDEALDLLFVDVGARLAKALTDLVNRFGQPSPTGIVVDHGLSQTQLAEMVGTSRETLNKQLHAFANRGWLTTGRGILVIHNPERLAHRAAITES
jgi:CRP-like cAMP-binding protein